MVPFSMILSDLTNYLMIQCIAPTLSDSWASYSTSLWNAISKLLCSWENRFLIVNCTLFEMRAVLNQIAGSYCFVYTSSGGATLSTAWGKCSSYPPPHFTQQQLHEAWRSLSATAELLVPCSEGHWFESRWGRSLRNNCGQVVHTHRAQQGRGPA